MSFEEKTTWVTALVSVVVTAWYVLTVRGLMGGVPVAEIAYQWPMVIAIGALIVLTIVGTSMRGPGMDLYAPWALPETHQCFEPVH